MDIDQNPSVTEVVKYEPLFDKLIKYLSFISFSFFLLNYTYLLSYYDSFNIKVSSYFTTPEILFAFSPALWYVFVFGLLLIQLLGMNVITFNLKLHRFWYLALLIVALLYFILMLISVYWDTFNVVTPYYELVYYSFIAFYFSKAVITKVLNNDRISFLRPIVILIASGAVLVFFARNMSKSVKKFGENYIYTFRYNGQPLSTKDKLTFIGECQSTLFFYQPSDSSTLIFERSKLDSIVVRSY
jgi:hypothetical protein